MRKLNNPQSELDCIHVAGTKGKGSTAIMLATILAQAGYKIGIYTSPHLVDLRERIQVWHNNRRTLISKNDFTNLMNRINHRLNNQKGLNSQRLQPTFFELMTALGFLHFTEQKVDIAVIEVGLGGRLDATNIIRPLVSIITRIDFDHIDKLGHTLCKIAQEKSGIIKPGVPVISFTQKTTADQVIYSASKNNAAPLHLAPILKHKLPVHGAHQSENWSLALKAVELMNKQKNIIAGPPAIKSALKHLRLPGRMELASKNPSLIIDGAHNNISIQATVDTIKKLKYNKLILIFALCSDKDTAKITRSICSLTDIIIFTRTNHPRLMNPEDFIRYLPKGADKIILIEPDYINALSMAKRLAQTDDLILITGSFYLAGEIKKLLKDK